MEIHRWNVEPYKNVVDTILSVIDTLHFGDMDIIVFQNASKLTVCATACPG